MSSAVPDRQHRLGWEPAPRLTRLATAALGGLLTAVITGHAALLLLAAPLLAALALGCRHRGPGTLRARVSASAARCFEGEDVELTVQLAADSPADEIAVRLELPGSLRLPHGPAEQRMISAAGRNFRWTVRPETWGRRGGSPVLVRCREGLWEATAEFRVPELEVYPQPPPAQASLVPAELRRRIGEHTARAPGGGVEFAGIRPFAPGDRLRDVNWPVSSRRRSLHANQRAADCAADLVVMVDAFSDLGPPGESTLDTAVRGAAGLARAYLGIGDRVGAVALGGVLRWLAPEPGGRQFFRIAEAVFDVRADSWVTPSLSRIPRTALPPGALVVLFSPLLDERAIAAISDLRLRGFSVIVVDVLREQPRPAGRSALSGLAARLGQVDRAALRTELASLGVPVLPWARGDSLAPALARLSRSRAPAFTGSRTAAFSGMHAPSATSPRAAP
jgi:uncharacterized protein (DUF58 family)